MCTSEYKQLGERANKRVLQFLDPRQVDMIDEALATLGEYGELRLIIEKGRLRFLITQKSFDALKWRPGALNEQHR